jgi:anaerobic selenocysteine-containing dehydrogenase
VLLDLGARLKLPGMVTRDGHPAYPGGYADYIVNHQRAPGLGPLAGWRGFEGGEAGRGAPSASQLSDYIANGCFWRGDIPVGARYFKMANAGYLTWATHMGFIAGPEQIVLHLYSEPLQRFRNAARGHGAAQPPDALRARIDAAFDPLPMWYMPFEEAAIDRAAYPLHALTQRPMQHYHSWGSQNAWLRQITAVNRLFMHHETAAASGIADDDWVWIISHAGRVKGQVRLVDGVNRDTVWTWNAIGKRSGSWALQPDAAESQEGFLLNHAISEWLPGPERRANSDPVTGQAAWFDLRVRVEKAGPDEQGVTEPRFDSLPTPPNIAPGPDVLRYGATFKGRS